MASQKCTQHCRLIFGRMCLATHSWEQRTFYLPLYFHSIQDGARHGQHSGQRLLLRHFQGPCGSCKRGTKALGDTAGPGGAYGKLESLAVH